MAARCGKQLPARCGELRSGVEPRIEALSRDGPRCSRHASQAEGFWVPRSAWRGIQKVAANQFAVCNLSCRQQKQQQYDTDKHVRTYSK